jgi:Kdo2-lipid IVA lauroyltransferase/acyltransferase
LAEGIPQENRIQKIILADDKFLFMELKKQIKIWQRNLARRTLVFFYSLLTRLPYGFVRVLMRVSLRIAFFFVGKLKRVARETLTIALGKEKSAPEIEAIIRGCFDTLGEGMVELMYYCRYPERVKDKFTIEGKAFLDQALSQRRGVVAVTAHFGNFPLMMLALAQYGYKVNCVMRRARDEKAGDLVLDIMTQVGVKTVYTLPRRECVNNSLRVLRENEILFILMDQNFGSNSGVFVDFFGQKAATAPGPVVFAERANSPIVPIFNVREAEGRHRIFIEPEYHLEQRSDHQDMLQVNVSRLTQIIERYIRKYPTEWGWMHRRFKSQAPANAVPVSEHLENRAAHPEEIEV